MKNLLAALSILLSLCCAVSGDVRAQVPGGGASPMVPNPAPNIPAGTIGSYQTNNGSGGFGTGNIVATGSSFDTENAPILFLGAPASLSANGQATIGADAVNGAIIQGQGSTNAVQLKGSLNTCSLNNTGGSFSCPASTAISTGRFSPTGSTLSGNAFYLPAGSTPAISANSVEAQSWTTTGTTLFGTITAAALSTTGAIAGSICATASGLILYESGATGCTISLRELKQNISDLNYQHATLAVMALKPVTFVMKDKPEARRIGFIAEDTQAADGRFATFDGEGNLQAYDPNAVLAATVAVVQQLKIENNSLRACNENWKCRLFGVAF